MAQELVKLRLTSNLTEERSEIIDKEFDGFQKLFGNFLAAESQVIIVVIWIPDTKNSGFQFPETDMTAFIMYNRPETRLYVRISDVLGPVFKSRHERWSNNVQKTIKYVLVILSYCIGCNTCAYNCLIVTAWYSVYCKVYWVLLLFKLTVW